ncbi:hypothetical protein GCM10027569_56550 [Flindersiella endophytica]
MPVRLFVSYAAVAVVGSAVAYVTVRLLAPRLFDHQMAAMNDSGMGGIGGMGGRMMSGVRAAFLTALDTALLSGALAGIIAAGLVAALGARRLLRPLSAVRDATRRIAAGDYEAVVPIASEPELAALATDVNRLARALGDTEARRTRLLGDVAHEMRTPLTALDGYVEGLIDGVFTTTPDTLASLSAELRRLHRLSDDLSSLSRAQEGRLDLSLSDVDLADLARRAAARLAPQFEDARIALVLATDENLPVRADADRLVQVLTNLLGNALLATPPDGTVTVTARRSQDRAEVAIADTGVGLAADDLERIFERFYRAPGQPRRSGGTGIGLTIAREIARAHGGSVTATSPGRGQGATFTLALPRRPI